MKKLILSLSVAVVMAMATIFGMMGLHTPRQNVQKEAGTNQETTTPAVTRKPKTYTYNANDVKIVKGGDVINYKYQPNKLLGDTASVTAYEYCFGSSMDETMAVSISSINTTDVEVSFTYSKNSPLDLSSLQTLTGETKFTTQTLENKGDYVYAYILVSPINQNIPTTFTRNIVWYYGKAGTVSITNSVTNETITQTIVKGQEVEMPVLDGVEEEDIKGWYLDPGCTIPAIFPLKTQGLTLYVSISVDSEYVIPSTLPEDWLQLNGDHYEVVRGTSELPMQLVIPSTYNGKPVTTIVDGDLDAITNDDYSSGVFYNQAQIVSVILPDTLEYIGVGAFANCTFIRTITIPESVTTVMPASFIGCTSLTKLIFENKSDWFVFNSSEGLALTAEAVSLYMGSDITDPVVAADMAKEDKTSAFMTLPNKPNLPSDWLTLEGDHYVVTKGTSELPSDILVIPDYYNDLPVTAIADANDNNLAFNGQTGLMAVRLPQTMKHIGVGAFSSCSNLLAITMPEGIETIGTGAFAQSGIMTINIPKTTKYVSQFVFYECSNLYTVALLDKADWYLNMEGESVSLAEVAADFAADGTDIYMPFVTAELVKYYSQVTWNKGAPEANLPSDWLEYSSEIDAYAVIKGTSELPAVVSIPSTYNDKPVVAINSGAFADCTNITEIYIPSSIGQIPGDSMAGCTNLTNVYIENKNDWYVTMDGMPITLEALSLAEGIDLFNPSIMAQIAQESSDMSIMNLPLLVKLYTTIIPDMAGYLPEDWLTLDDDHYVVTKGTSALPQMLIIPDYYNGLPVTHIAGGDVEAGLQGDFSSFVFAGQSIAMVILPETMKHIGDGAFASCQNLVAITMPEGIKTIGMGAFAYSGLTSINIPKSATYIGMGACLGCENLVAIALLDKSDWILEGDGMVMPLAELAELAAADGTDIYNPAVLRELFVAEDALITWTKGAPTPNLPSDYLYYMEEMDSYAVIKGSSTLPAVLSIPSEYEGKPVLMIMDAFTNNTDVTSIYVPESIAMISSNSFYGCTNLEEIYLANQRNWYMIMEEDSEELAITLESYSMLLEMLEGVSLFDPAVLAEMGRESSGGPDMMNMVGYASIYANLYPEIAGYLPEDWLTQDGDHYIVTKGTSALPQMLIIPDYYNGLPVTHIAGGDIDAFMASEDISSFVFAGNTDLLFVVLPETMKHIGDGAFIMCESLQAINMPEGLETIGMGAFLMTGLNSINLPKTLTDIGMAAFTGCEKLQMAAFLDTNNWMLSTPEGVTSLDEFAQAEGIGEQVYLPYYTAMLFVNPEFMYFSLHRSAPKVGVNESDGFTFEYDSASDGYYIVGLTTSFSGDVVIPDTFNGSNGELPVTGLKGALFANNTNITSLTIPASVSYISASIVAGCSSLTAINLVDPNGWNLTDGSDKFPMSNITPEDLATMLKGISVSNAAGVWLIKLEQVVVNGLTLESGENGWIVISADSTLSGAVVIPDTYDNISITAIANGVFKNNTNITSVTLSSNLTAIGNNAFYKCTGLTGDLTIPSGVTSIGEYAFYNCSKLTSMTLPSSLTSIGNQAFYGCRGLTGSLVIPSGVTSIGSYTFYNCSGLTSVTIPASITSINSEAFYGCTSLVVVYNLSSLNITAGSSGYGYVAYYALAVYKDTSTEYSIQTIGNVKYFVSGTDFIAFGPTSTSITTITLDSRTTAIKNNAFQNCTSLTTLNMSGCTQITNIGFIDSIKQNLTTIDLSGCTGLTVIASSAFQSYTRLTSINLSGCTSLTAIGSSAFSGCSGLTSITLPSSLTSIGNFAFYGCRVLTSITLPNGLTSIGADAFRECYSLAEVYNLSSLNITVGSSSYGYVAYYAKVIYTSLDEPSRIQTIDNMYYYVYGTDFIAVGPTSRNTTSVTLDSRTTKINQYAFYECSGLTSIDLGGCISLTTIGEYAFEHCSRLTSVTLPSSLISIGNFAFAYCSGLTSIDLSGCTSLTSIGNQAFSDCSGLTSITLPSSLTSIGNSAFYKCSGLTSIVIPASVTNVGTGVFGSCNNLTSIVVESGNTVYDSRNNCNAIIATSTNTLIQGCNNTVIPNDIASIGDNAFSGCRGLTSINLPSSLTSIGAYAFDDCSRLTSVTLPSSLSSIGYQAFASSGLTSIVIPEGITSIGDSAFSGCSGLTSVTLPSSLTGMNQYVFYSCNSLVEVYNLSSITITIGSTDNGYVGYYAKVIHTSLDEPSRIQTIDNVLYYVYGTDFIALTPTSKDITTLTLDSRTTSINQYAFYNCNGLTSIDLSGCTSLTSIGDYAFRDCDGLTSIVIPASVSKIGYCAFYGCYGTLTSLTFASGGTWYYTSNSDYIGGTSVSLVAGTNYANGFTSQYSGQWTFYYFWRA